VLVTAELLRAFGARSEVKTLWQVGLFSNMWLVVIVVASFALQLAIHHIPVLQMLFGTEPISLRQCIAWLALGAIPMLTLELRKVWWQSRQAGKPGEEATA
jgi:Ca2+-transporting ATPase